MLGIIRFLCFGLFIQWTYGLDLRNSDDSLMNKAIDGSKTPSPMDRFLAKNEDARENILNNLFSMNLEDDYNYDEPSEKPKVVDDSQVNEQKILENQEKTFYDMIRNMDFLPLLKSKLGRPTNIKMKIEDDTELMNHLNTIRKDAWKHFKNIIVTYVNTFDNEEHTLSNSLPIKLLMKTLDMGDNLNIIHLLGKKVDPALYDFMESKMGPISNTLTYLTNATDILEHSTNSTNQLVNSIAWMAMRHIIDDLLDRVESTGSMDHLKQYIETIRKMNPYAAKGIEFVLSFRKNQENSGASEGRGYKSRIKSSKRSPESSRYEDSDYYDYEDDKYYEPLPEERLFLNTGPTNLSVTLDPYLILAAVGTTALLAYIAYLVLTTTAAPRKLKKRSVDIVPVEQNYFIIDAIEKFENMVDGQFAKYAEEFVEDANDMWRFTHTNDECQKCNIRKRWLNKRFEESLIKTFARFVFNLFIVIKIY